MTKKNGRPKSDELAVAFLLWLLLLLANILDYSATKHALGHGIFEVNPGVARLIDLQAFNLVLGFKVICLVILLVLLRHIVGWKLNLMAFVASVYLALATYHIYGTYVLEQG